MKILYYVTSHGFGHLNRAAAVLEALPSNVSVVVQTQRDLFDRCRECVGRPVQLREGVFDCGAVHPPGESSLVDPRATLERYRAVHGAALSRLEQEVEFQRAGRFAVVVSDAASLPLRAAREAGLPGALVANFTWSDIFRPFLRRAAGPFREMLHEMDQEYAMAQVFFRAQPAVPARRASRVSDVGLIARRGQVRRRELLWELDLPASTRLVYLYVGRYGQDDMEWLNLSRLSEFHFVGYHSLGLELANWHRLDPARWPPRDLAASVDAMVAKAGYGTVTDAMTHRVSLVFPPRFGFVEHRVLARALRDWGGGIPTSTARFKRLELRRELAEACRRRPRRSPWPTDGAQRCARGILKLAVGMRFF